ncbi:3-phosphoshikimate 1-carboxyvinyltransferase [Gimesia chilikensis]|uniref:3-phosphoshikimate 1-carboxyvinyltransferase n=1 Tax=Gimesia chilikensis TaxID=2605989 RepID=A0A517PTJ6_9PLAN|nr:3-phosphoshikimate 1-carboxyvinyltransferase [Gimesia chilikensis]QDT22705.1 3-phosphoshikimate 1-carboxyvinyltransferase [Gimesia chilikensis]
MSDTYQVQPVSGPLNGTVRPPGSKSITNRALIVAALAEGQTELTGVLDSRDTQVMIESLNRLGINVDHDPENCTVVVQGCGGQIPASEASLWLENSGTSIRFLTALCSVGQGEFQLDGNTRMRQRPIQDLIDALAQLGVDVSCESDTGCPPVRVKARGLLGGETAIAGNVSSQYLSALLMVTPAALGPTTITIQGEMVSRPYLDITLGVMAQFGVTIDRVQNDVWRILPQTYQRPGAYDIEPDASAASYFFAAAAITGGSVTVDGLNQDALQGDINFIRVLEDMGCNIKRDRNSITVHGKPLKGIDVDMNEISDTAQTLAAVALFAEGPTCIRNVAHIRHKETDRLSAIATELKRMGIQVEETDDSVTIHPGDIQPAVIETYDDHRMAMSFALVGLKVPGIQIADPGCTAKTYPRFFDDLERLCGQTS